MNYAIRLPVAFLLGLAFATGLFWFLWIAVSGHGGFGEMKPAVKIDFTALRHDTETETKREKVVQPKPEKMPEIPQISQPTGGIDNAQRQFRERVVRHVEPRSRHLGRFRPRRHSARADQS